MLPNGKSPVCKVGITGAGTDPGITLFLVNSHSEVEPFLLLREVPTTVAGGLPWRDGLKFLPTYRGLVDLLDRTLIESEGATVLERFACLTYGCVRIVDGVLRHV